MKVARRLLATLSDCATVLLVAKAAQAAEPTVRVYGPGGPAPAMKEAANAFSAAAGTSVEVVAGPTPQWVDRAKADGDVIFSGAENMFGDFAKAMPDVLDLRQAEPIALRPVAILVQPGNPKRIGGFRGRERRGRRRHGRRHDRRLSTTTPSATRPMPSHSRGSGRSPRKSTAKTATSTTLSLSTGATCEASPILSARR